MNGTHYISSWEIYTSSISQELQKALTDNKIGTESIVWTGPSGDAIVADSAGDLDEEYAEYVDSGLVSEYISD